jgi:hypothetical protein
MRTALQYAGWLIGLPLELLIVAALTRGSFRRFPFLLFYSVALFLTTVLEISVYEAYSSGIRLTHSRAFYYWLDEGIRQALLFAVVISLVYRASAPLRLHGLIRCFLVLGAVVFAGATFVIHYDPSAVVGEWMTLWTRDLNFSSAVLDLALWAMLIGSKYKETQLLLLSGALGIQFTGEAIGQSLRHLLPWSLSPGDVMTLLANLACLWIWWQALRPPRRHPRIASA